MEVRSCVQFDVVKESRTYSFIMPVGGSLGEGYDAAFQVLEKILEMSKNAADKAKPAQPAEEKKDEANGEKQS